MYGREADAIRERKGGSEAWNVRPALKYLWKTSNRCPKFLGYNRDKFCALVGRRNILFVGDSTQLALHDVFLNHLKTIRTAKDVGDVGDAW